MKKLCTLLLAAAMTCAAAGAAQAIDFKVKGQWNMGFAVGETSLVKNTRDGAGVKTKGSNEDTFAARQRVLLQLDAVASENLSGTVMFHIGPQAWGRAGQGGALGADGVFVKVRQAYIDWLFPNTSLRTRMGIQNFALPSAAGGSAVFDVRGAAVNAHYDFNDNVGLTALWFRPYNDNYGGWTDGNGKTREANYLDNMDLFALMLPLHFDGLEVTPWAMYGMRGRNVLDNGRGGANGVVNAMDGNPYVTMTPYLGTQNGNGHGLNVANYGRTSKAYGGLFWAGLPVVLKAFEPWNIEFDINYGYVEEMGRFDVMVRNDANNIRRGSTKREGWLAKLLVEYKLDWGVPGIFAWYGSGDDGNVKNGSERMPGLAPYVYTTSFMGDGNLYWSPRADLQDINTSLAGTWGFGLQLRDMHFLDDDLSHTFRVAYWGGTNSPSMVKYMDSAYAWNGTGKGGTFEGPYLTTNDALLEFNLVNVYQMYENFDINVELGYIANFMDDGTWKRHSYNNFGSYEKQDIWKAHVIFTYKF